MRATNNRRMASLPPAARRLRRRRMPLRLTMVFFAALCCCAVDPVLGSNIDGDDARRQERLRQRELDVPLPAYRCRPPNLKDVALKADECRTTPNCGSQDDDSCSDDQVCTYRTECVIKLPAFFTPPPAGEICQMKVGEGSEALHKHGNCHFGNYCPEGYRCVSWVNNARVVCCSEERGEVETVEKKDGDDDEGHVFAERLKPATNFVNEKQKERARKQKEKERARKQKERERARRERERARRERERKRKQRERLKLQRARAGAQEVEEGGEGHRV